MRNFKACQCFVVPSGLQQTSTHTHKHTQEQHKASSSFKRFILFCLSDIWQFVAASMSYIIISNGTFHLSLSLLLWSLPLSIFISKTELYVWNDIGVLQYIYNDTKESSSSQTNFTDYLLQYVCIMQMSCLYAKFIEQ